MDTLTHSPLVVRFLDFNSSMISDPENLSLSLISKTEKFALSLGQSKEINSNSFDVSLILDEKIIGNNNFIEFSEDFDGWVPFDEIGSVRLSAVLKKGKKHLKIKRLNQDQTSKCQYLKRILTIIQSEEEIQHELMALKHQIPDLYQYIICSSIVTSPSRASIRKKTIESESLKEKMPDYSFPSYFDVNLDNISCNEPDLLQNVAIGLLLHVTQLKLQVNEYEKNKETIMDYDGFMKNLEDSLNETKEQCFAEQELMNKKEQEILNEINPIENETAEVEEKISKTNEEISEIKKEIDKKIKENNQERCQGAEKEIIESKELRKKIEDIHNEIMNLEKNYAEMVEVFENKYPEPEMAVAINEKILNLAELQHKINIRDMCIQEMIQLQTEIAITEGQLQIEDDLVNQNASYLTTTSSLSKATLANNRILEEYSLEQKTNLKASNEFTSEFSASIQTLLNNYTENEKNLKQSEKKHEELVQKTENIKGITEILKQKTKKTEPRDIILSHFIKEYPQTCEINSTLLKELDYISDKFLNHSEVSFKSRRFYRQVSDTLETQNLQHLSMNKLIGDIKKENLAYVPVKNDSTDIALAKYLNANYNNLEVRFKRLDKQIYNFGTIKIEVKLEGDIIVNLDGKILTIEEFLKIYTPVEKNKVFKRSGSLAKCEKKGAKIGKYPSGKLE